MKRGVKLLLLFLSFLLGAGVFAFLIWKEGFDNIVGAMLDFGWLAFLGFVGISLINFVLYSLRWQLITNSHLPKKKRVPLRRMYMHRMAGYAMSYLTPAAQVGGEPVRVGMLMSDGVSSKEATSSVALDITVELIAYIAFIVAGVILALMTGLDDGGSLIWIAGVLVFFLLLLFAFLGSLAKGNGGVHRLIRKLRLDRVKRLEKVNAWIKETEDLMTSFLRGKHRLLVAVAFLAFTVIFFRVVEVFYIAFFFGVSLTFAQAFLIATLPGIALILPVPAGLGVFEGGFAAVFAVLGVPLTAVAFSLIIRLRDAIFIGVGSVHMIRRGGVLFGRTFKGKK